MMYLAGKGHQVVFTETKDLNVLDNDELVVILVEYSTVDNVSQILLVPLGEEHHGFGIALRSTVQTLSVRILTDTLEESANRARELV